MIMLITVDSAVKRGIAQALQLKHLKDILLFAIVMQFVD